MLHLLFRVLALACCLGVLAVTDAAIVQKTFIVGNLTASPLCKEVEITAVNGTLPGPTIEVTEGDTLVVDIVNQSPYNLTIHWHGIHQRRTPWYDGPDMITQCPIAPGQSFLNNFTITGQEGTLWWHAHISWLRATVYGAIVIRPNNYTYPFSKPDVEVPILLGEWWDQNVVDLANQAFITGMAEPVVSSAYTINGLPGDLYTYNCSINHTYILDVDPGKIYMLRIINAALNSQHFFQVANHTFTVVALDAQYTEPYNTDVIVIASGQTVDALMVANATPAIDYYMTARQFNPAWPNGPKIDDTTTTAIVHYPGANETAAPVLPDIVPINDPNSVGNKFYTGIKGLIRQGSPTVPTEIDEDMFITVGLGRKPCRPEQTGCSVFAIGASMNNISFALPTRMSILEASYRNVTGVYTSDFPDNPPMIFNYTSQTDANDPLTGLMFPEDGTKVKRLNYGAKVQIVLQNTAILGPGYHPMHLHGYDFFVIAQGFGNYDSSKVTFDLENPQSRNTIAVPAGGWAVIRFVSDNPGVWYMHCHLEDHVQPGLMMAFEVESGGTPETSIIPPPPDFPTC